MGSNFVTNATTFDMKFNAIYEQGFIRPVILVSEVIRFIIVLNVSLVIMSFENRHFVTY